MRINLALWDRFLRIVFGIFFAAWAVAGGPWWAYTGVYLIFTGSWGLCPIYSYFKFRTVKLPDHQRFVP